jgi:GNAT superfamily N-acetyltransferase
MEKKIVATPAKITDLEAVVTVLDETAQTLREKGTDYWAIYRKDNEHYEKWAKPRIVLDVGMGKLYLAKSNGEVVGTFTIGTKPLEWQQPLNQVSPWNIETPALYLSRVAVRPLEERKGYARQILKLVEEEAARFALQVIRLDTVNQSQTMRSIAQKSGYAIVHERQEDAAYRFFLQKSIS